jgi:sulfite exporter TauE/SafE
MEIYIAALSLGFVGSFHCIGMCGPIAMALPLGDVSKYRRVLGAVVYNLGRILTYSLFGALFGLLGKGFIIAGFQQALSILLGLLILLTLVISSSRMQQFSLLQFASPLVTRLKSSLGKLFRQKSLASLFNIGILNGLLPCGLVYLGIAGAIATGDSWRGSLFMASFGLGTLPAMLFVVMASQLVSLNFRNKIRKAVPVFIASMALVLILRGMNLGIPYLSPELSKTDCTKHSCCQRK